MGVFGYQSGNGLRILIQVLVMNLSVILAHSISTGFYSCFLLVGKEIFVIM